MVTRKWGKQNEIILISGLKKEKTGCIYNCTPSNASMAELADATDFGENRGAPR